MTSTHSLSVLVSRLGRGRPRTSTDDQSLVEVRRRPAPEPRNHHGRPRTFPAKARLALLAAAPLALTGCGFGTDLYSTTLPGGADVGDNPITISASFSDVVDLVPQSSVKVENIAVGRVKSIELGKDGRTAEVEILVRRDVDLPTGTRARLQQTSLLGEKYISLNRPEAGQEGAGSLTNGSVIPIDDTSQQAEVEHVLGALSLVVNGGGIAKFRDISRELQQVSTGRPEEIKAFLQNMETFVTNLDTNKQALTDALDSMATLSTTLEGDKDKITTALEGLSPGMQVLSEQRTQLVEMLTSLDELSEVSIRTLDASQADMVEDMKLLEPILEALADSGSSLPNSLEMLLTYPFPDSVLGVIKGDYFNVFATANYTSLPDSCTGLGCPWPQYPDTGSNPPVDALATTTPTPLMVQPSSPSSPISGATTPSTPATAGTPSASASASPSGSPSASASASATSTPTASSTPAPTLLPPTDSAFPGIPEPSVQVPLSSLTATAQED